MALEGPLESFKIQRATTVDRVAAELRRACFEGELAPGTPLREVALAESLRVGRSTVREALGILVGEGLAVRTPNKGTQVRSLDADAIADVIRARVVLETAGLRNWRQASLPAREGVRRAFQTYAAIARGKPSQAALNQAHLDIHRSFVVLAGSQRLVGAADALYAEIRLALAGVDRIRRNARDQVRSHRVLVDFLEADDVDAAVLALAEHLAGAEVSVTESLTL